ncbi:MAG: FAD-binding oxidoreductase [Chloroflexales bacterium]|nr:FAD-binding oxidoreductase [Chloroflexales bacterium]
MNDCSLYGTTPQSIVTPGDIDAVAATLRQATTERLGVVPWGKGTRQHLGNPPNRYDLALCLSHLDHIVEYNPADLVVTVEAGMTLDSFQQILVAHEQWLPWDPPQGSQSSIGSLLATAASGPLCLGFGTPRDWILGMRVVLGDGRLVKSGAKVVKNVAGYDTHKLHLGALGTLGVIVEATFKVTPLAPCSTTLLLAFNTIQEALAAAGQLRVAPLSPASLIVLNNIMTIQIAALHNRQIDNPDLFVVAVRFIGVQAAVGRQVREAVQRATEAGMYCMELSDEHDHLIWQSLVDNTARSPDGTLVLRIGVKPRYIGHVAACLEQIARQYETSCAYALYAGVGLACVLWRFPADVAPSVVSSALTALRAAIATAVGKAPADAYVVVEDAPPNIRSHLDIWGPAPETMRLMQQLKAQWDPAGVLNPGRYLL